MFTGIIENLGEITAIEVAGENKTFTVKSSLTPELKIDQSVAHNGVCLTVIAINKDEYKVTAIKETLDITASGNWLIGQKLNLERAAKLNARLDGHIVQGHVDSTAKVKSIENENGSWRYTFEFPSTFAPLIISKGSICVDGVSLTAISPSDNTFQVAIIPYTYEHTVFHQYKVEDYVNIEYDLIGKYIFRRESLEKYA
jgi:riboflavin synthase